MKKTFVFESYQFDHVRKQLELHYSLDELEFVETYTFDFDYTNYDEQSLDHALRVLFYIAGVSYYKTFVPKTIETKLPLEQPLARFLQGTYQKGLGEFLYVNKLDPRMSITFPADSSTVEPSVAKTEPGLLVGIGGGKDSLLSIELLKQTDLRLATWSLNHRQQLEPLVNAVGLDHFWVEREWDPQLKDIVAEHGAYNGHVPISAIFAAVGSVVGVLTGYQDHVVSNEQSANEPTLTYEGVAINHQYSKSQEFEQAYQQLLSAAFGGTLRYYSLLRPLSELRIAELFGEVGLEKYAGLFSSCNRAYTQDSPGLFWDGKCSKCAFVYLVLAPFVDEQKLNDVIGHNLLNDPDLRDTYNQLLGIAGDKPLECVGEIQESRKAMSMMQERDHSLMTYEFELDHSYDFRELRGHLIPPEIYGTIAHQLEQRP